MLTPGTRLAVYEVLSPLGRGGMGEVYRARDTRLNRDVAIKILPEAFASDPERVARFTREAQTLAALNHPHIAQIHGVDDAGGVRALVMELVEGETLAETIARGPIPIDEALPIARQIAEALEAAHAAGVIHRDLKPANIKRRPDGTVKVLDFGLALQARGAASSSADRGAAAGAHSPTFTSPLVTDAGRILGTAAYMAPEQAKGRPVDRRADIWAFGCVLYEMLTGKHAFAGEDVSDTLAAVLRAEPDWNALPQETPPAVRTAVQQSLIKDAGSRLGAIETVLFLLRQPATIDRSAAASPAPARAVWRIAATAITCAVVFGALGAWGAWRYREPAPGNVVRFSITLPPGQSFTGTGSQAVTISPDGTRIAYIANRQLYVRPLGTLNATAIAGSGAPGSAIYQPAFSPDGQWIAFVDEPRLETRALKKVSVAGGAVITLCPTERPSGMTWGSDGIVFGQGDGIYRVSPNGGTAELLVKVGPEEQAHGPLLLPGGRHVLFTLAQGFVGFERWETAKTVVHSLASGDRTVLLDGGADARYLPTGHLIYVRQGIVSAVPFDPERLAVLSGPVPVVEGVTRTNQGQTGAVQLATSTNGSLVYVPGPLAISTGAYDLAWVDRAGNVERFKLPVRNYLHPRVSPDGRRIVFGTDDGKEAHIWVHDLAGSSAPRQLTFEGHNRDAIWMSKDDRVAFQSDRGGDEGIFAQTADGTDRAERLTKAEPGTSHIPYAWSPDDQQLLFGVVRGNDRALWRYIVSDRRTERFGKVETPGGSPNAAFSPDGKWVAYASGSPTTRAIFVQNLATGAEFRVSPPEETPASPFWSPDQSELFYVQVAGIFVAVRPDLRSGFSVGSPTAVPSGGRVALGAGRPRNYDISRDGKRFLIVVPAQGELTADERPINVVLNWFEELKQRVPVPR